MDFQSAAISSPSAENILPVPPRDEGMADCRALARIVHKLEKLPVINGAFSERHLHDLGEQSASGRGNHPGTSVFLGIGLCTPREFSQGLPFDVIGQVCAAEWTRRVFKYDKILIVIGDKHAKLNIKANFETRSPNSKKFETISPDDERRRQVNKTAEKNRETLTAIAKALGIARERIVIKLASEIAKSEDYPSFKARARVILDDQQVPSPARPYAYAQSATVEWAIHHYGVKAKMSWLATKIEANRTSKTIDEFFFDDIHTRHFGKPSEKDGQVAPFNIIGTDPGHTFLGSQPIIPPYVLLGETAQIPIAENIDCRLVVAKAQGISERAAANVAANFPGIIQAIEMIRNESLAGKGWVDKANNFLDLVYPGSSKRALIRARSIERSLHGMPERMKNLKTFEKLAGHTKSR
ncbi:MAG: hypothetical protein AB7G80_01425 [Dongiaceae bacterium]